MSLDPKSIVIGETLCPHCGKVVSRKYLRFVVFRKDYFPVTEREAGIWEKRCCYLCKKKPVVGETWGIAIGHKEKNRLFCPECAEEIEKKIKEASQTEKGKTSTGMKVVTPTDMDISAMLTLCDLFEEVFVRHIYSTQVRADNAVIEEREFDIESTEDLFDFYQKIKQIYSHPYSSLSRILWAMASILNSKLLDKESYLLRLNPEIIKKRDEEAS